MKKFLLLFIIALLMQGVPVLADEYVLDPDHSEVGFSVKHLLINNIKGAFREYSAGFAVDENAKLLSVQTEIKVTSIDTRVAKRDEHLRSPDFFEVTKFPVISFKSTAIAPGEGGSSVVTGLLKIKGIEKEIRLTGELSGPVQDPWGQKRMGIALHGTIDRTDFGVSYNAVLETGGLLVDNTVTIHLEGEGVLKK